MNKKQNYSKNNESRPNKTKYINIIFKYENIINVSKHNLKINYNANFISLFQYIAFLAGNMG